MLIVKPTTYNIDTILDSTTIPENDFAVWNAATNYTLGTKVIRTQTHRIYQNLSAGVDAGLPENTPGRWQDVAPTNAYAMFDALSSTQSLATTSLTFVIDPDSRLDSLCFINLKGSTLTITATNDGAEEIYNKVIDLNTGYSTSWYGWFFEPFVQKRDVFLFDFPVTYLHPIITVTISTDVGVNCGLGRFLYGKKYDLGHAERQGTSLTFRDNSAKTTDANNNVSLTKKNNVKLLRLSPTVSQAEADRTINVLRDLLSVPCVFVGAQAYDGYDYLTVYGFYQSFSIAPNNAKEAPLTIEVEELT